MKTLCHLWNITKLRCTPLLCACSPVVVHVHFHVRVRAPFCNACRCGYMFVCMSVAAWLWLWPWLNVATSSPGGGGLIWMYSEIRHGSCCCCCCCCCVDVACCSCSSNSNNNSVWHCFALNAIYVAVSRTPSQTAFPSSSCNVLAPFTLLAALFLVVGVNARTCVEQKAVTSKHTLRTPHTPHPTHAHTSRLVPGINNVLSRY